MTHNRECPKCGLIVEWTRGEKVTHVVRGIGEITAYKMHLICPEHGEFEPRAHAKLNEAWARVERSIKKRFEK